MYVYVYTIQIVLILCDRPVVTVSLLTLTHCVCSMATSHVYEFTDVVVQLFYLLYLTLSHTLQMNFSNISESFTIYSITDTDCSTGKN